MKALARAVINAAAFLELSDDQSLDPELATQALEEIAFHLSHCSPEEKQALLEVLAEMRAAELESGPRIEMMDFLDSFPATFGLVEEDPGDPDFPPRINLL